MPKKSHKRKQKLYKMVGCSKTKRHLGGSADVPMAYTGHHHPAIPNPHLAYVGRGGTNYNAVDPTIPNSGPIPNPGGGTIFNIASQQRGGCGGTCGLMKGGCGGTCGLMKGGKSGCSICQFLGQKGGHRRGCKCSACKSKKHKGMKGGNPYPNGLVGSSWTSNPSSWPGVGGVPGNSNHYELNTFARGDVSRQMRMSGGKKTRKQRGGTMSNFIGQDLINLGRQFQFGVGSAYNALAGYAPPVNPLPWKDQFPTKMTINPATI